jgi:hypothetical protein
MAATRGLYQLIQWCSALWVLWESGGRDHERLLRIHPATFQ